MATKIRKTRLQHVAEKAGVSSATVDRVLNERGNVLPTTAQKVIIAARQLGLRRILPGSYHRSVRIEVLLTRPELPLIKRMNHYFANIAATLDRSVIVQRHILKDDDPKKFARHLIECKAQGIILYGREDADVRDAIATVAAAGKVVVTVISDMRESARYAYAGIDHYAAGRSAGFFMSRMAARPGSVVILCNHHKYHGHVERIRGMRDALRETGRQIAVSDVLEGRDEGPRSESLLNETLRGRKDVIGIYNAGAANLAVERAILKSSLVEPIFIGHELTENTIRMLREGIMTLTIDQNPERQARNAVNLILNRYGYGEAVADLQPRDFVPFTIYTLENLPTTI
jgi:LacI family transcriptional regulator